MRNFTIIAAIFFLQTACLEVQEKDIDYGAEVTLGEIYKTMQEPLGSSSAANINQHEKSESTLWAYIARTGDQFLVQKEVRDVVSREDKTTYWRFGSALTTTDYTDGKPTVRDPKLDYTNVAKAKGLSEETFGLFEASNLDAGTNKVTFHQLKKDDFLLDMHEKVKNKSVCATIPDCKIRARKIKVVQVNWMPDGKKRHDLEFVVSPDVPYFSRLLRQCDTYLRDFGGGRAMPLTVCNDITDFDFGVAW